MATAQAPKKIRTIEGITEYQLDNGLQVLLFPDESKPTVTVNVTYFVGSRHEGYGEAGMAHLLEHMLFKGTPLHKNVPKELGDRGAQFNGTTSLDRTNYYETLPSSDENLKFAIRFEADRMINSYVKKSDLDSEMTVVRNEFERGENSPSQVLMQRMMGAAYEWHNYGKSTIGNRSDIERVPIDRLKAFYRKHYQPDNAMLVVAGSFDTDNALEYAQEYFGSIDRPERIKDNTYTEEPAQDGEREVTLRRVGEKQIVAAAYHIPSGSHPDFESLRVLGYILGTEPSGRLYKALIETKIGTAVSTFSWGLHDPGLILMDVELKKDGDLAKAKEVFLKTIQDLGESGVTEEEVERAKTEILAQRELSTANTTQVAVSLSNWASQGDWRLYFLSRDRVEKVTAEKVQEVAQKYLQTNNRTTGIFIPSEKAVRIAVPSSPDLGELLADYKGRKEIISGEKFDPTPANIQKRTTYKELGQGIKVALLPKKNRGETVVMNLTLRYGNEASLKGLVTAGEFLPQMLSRGTKELNFEQLQDEFTKNRIAIRASGLRGLTSVNLQTKRENLPRAIELVRQMLREATLPESEFETLKQQAIQGLRSSLAEPQALAIRKVQRTINPYGKDDIRYIPTIEEEIERVEQCSLSQLQTIYNEYFGSQAGEVAIVGDFDADEVMPLLGKIFENWESRIEFARIPEVANTNIKGQTISIETPDKANAIYLSALGFKMKDGDKNYPGLVIGNYILGGGTLSSRLADRVRQKEGLSYAVQSMANVHPVDDRGSFMVFAITNPANKDKLVSVIGEELRGLLSDGITAEELERAKQGYLQNQKVSRTRDSAIAQMLIGNIFAGRDMKYQEGIEKKVENLSVAEVNKALKANIDLDRLTIVTAGDFAKAKEDANKGAEKSEGDSDK